MEPIEADIHRNRIRLFEIWIEHSRELPSDLRLDNGVIRLSNTTPGMDWGQVIAKALNDQGISDYFDSVKQIATTARLVPDTLDDGHWVYEFIHQAALNVKAGRTPLPLKIGKPFIEIPEVPIPRSPITGKSGVVSPLDIRWYRRWIERVYEEFKASGWQISQSDRLLTVRREWFFFRHVGCGWSYADIAEEYSEADDQFRSTRDYLEAADIGRDVLRIAKSLGLRTRVESAR